MARLWTYGAETGSIDEAGVPFGGANTATIVTTPGVRSGTYALYLGGSNNDRGRQFAFTASDEIYFTFSVYFTSLPISVYNWLQLMENSTIHLALDIINTGTVNLERGTTVIATATEPFALNTLYWCQGHAKIADAGGVFELWANGIKVLDFSGDTRNAATGALNSFVLLQEFAAVKFIVDDLKINNTSGAVDNAMPGDGAVLYLPANGNGAHAVQWTGSDGNQVDNYALVDEVPPATADYVQTSSADKIDTYALADVPAAYNTITLVQPIAYAALNVAGTGSLRCVLHSSDGDHLDAADTMLTTAYGFVRGDIYYTDPADSGAWTIAKVNALEAGVKSV